jgi:branched-subunit amino acid transport protein AzlD
MLLSVVAAVVVIIMALAVVPVVIEQMYPEIRLEAVHQQNQHIQLQLVHTLSLLVVAVLVLECLLDQDLAVVHRISIQHR